MRLFNLTRLAVVGTLAVALSGCFDADFNVEILDSDTAHVTTRLAMDKSIYQMSQADESSADKFCEEGEVELTDTQAICSVDMTGSFEELMKQGAANDEPQPTISEISPGKVKVTFPTNAMDIGAEMSGNDAPDEQTMKMMAAMFAGHNIVITVTGKHIDDTNMDLSDDKTTATLTIPLDGLMAGTADVPDEAYAIVDVR